MSPVEASFAPRTLAEALEQAASLGGRPLRFIAGCTDFMVALLEKKVDPAFLIDLSRIADLHGIKDEGDTLRVGALTTHQALVESHAIRTHAPLLAEACADVGSPQIRNRGTIGGNICTGSPAGDGLPPLAVLGARFHLSHATGERTVPFAEFFTGPQRTVLREGEVLTAVTFEKMAAAERHAWRKLGTRKAQTIAKISLAARCRVVDGTLRDVRIALGSVAPTVVRAARAEAYLEGRRLEPGTAREAEAVIRTDIRPIDDIRSTARYRLHAAGVLLRRFVEELAATR